jgi:hypothetical protein
MSNIINADNGVVSGTPGLKYTADSSGILQIQTGTSVTAITIDTSQNTTLNTTGALTLPVGTTAQRPTPVTGMTRYNTAFGGLEVYNGTDWSLISNGPTMFVYFTTGGQSLTGGAQTKISFTTENWDTAGAFNNTASTVTLNGLSVPAYSFCPPIAGYYKLTGMVQLASGGINCSVDFLKNGSFDAVNGYRGELAAAQGPAGSAIVYLNGTGDYVDMRVYVATTVATSNQAGANYFQAAFVRGA